MDDLGVEIGRTTIVEYHHRVLLDYSIHLDACRVGHIFYSIPMIRLFVSLYSNRLHCIVVVLAQLQPTLFYIKKVIAHTLRTVSLKVTYILTPVEQHLNPIVISC